MLGHAPLECDGLKALDLRLIELVQIYDEQLPRMGGLQLLRTMQQEDCASIVCTIQKRVVGGCTFKMHNIQAAQTRLQTLLDNETSCEREPESFVELLLLGVAQKE